MIRAHFRQLRARGNAFKVAMVACTRKLLVILNAMVKQQTPWQSVISPMKGGKEVEQAKRRIVESVQTT